MAPDVEYGWWSDEAEDEKRKWSTSTFDCSEISMLPAEDQRKLYRTLLRRRCGTAHECRRAVLGQTTTTPGQIECVGPCLLFEARSNDSVLLNSYIQIFYFTPWYIYIYSYSVASRRRPAIELVVVGEVHAR